MKRQRPSKRDIEALCADPGPEDGLRPEDWNEPTPVADACGRKHRQLAGQIDRTLCFLLSETNEPALADVDVLTVVMNVDGRNATVTLASETPTETHEALGRATPWLRTALASTIHRRHVPTLRFVVVPAGKEERDA